jgi:WhiB family redox-sensing transcriptional regulator
VTAVSTTLKPILDQWEWQFEGACNGTDPGAFFLEHNTRGSTKHDKEQRAVAICSNCPVKKECLDHALSVPEVFGVWGGKTEKQRELIAKELGITYKIVRI